MLLDDLKILIKDFEGILSKDLRFKEDMYFKNQVKIIYSKKEKTKNVFVPLMLANLSNLWHCRKIKAHWASLGF